MAARCWAWWCVFADDHCLIYSRRGNLLDRGFGKE